MSSNNSQPPSPPGSPFGGPTSHTPTQAPQGPTVTPVTAQPQPGPGQTQAYSFAVPGGVNQPFNIDRGRAGQNTSVIGALNQAALNQGVLGSFQLQEPMQATPPSGGYMAVHALGVPRHVATMASRQGVSNPQAILNTMSGLAPSLHGLQTRMPEMSASYPQQMTLPGYEPEDPVYAMSYAAGPGSGFSTIGQMVHTAGLMSNPQYQRAAIDAVNTDFLVGMQSTRQAMNSNMRNAMEAASVVSETAIDMPGMSNMNIMQAPAHIQARAIQEIMDSRGLNPEMAASEYAQSQITSAMQQTFRGIEGQYNNLDTKVRREVAANTRTLSVAELITAKGMEAAIQGMAAEHRLSPEQQRAGVVSMNYATALDATQQMLDEQPTPIREIAGRTFVTNPYAATDVAMPIDDVTANVMETLPHRQRDVLSETGYSVALGNQGASGLDQVFSPVPTVGGGAGGGGAGGGGGGAGGGGGGPGGADDPYRRLSEMLAAAVQDMIRSIRSASDGLEGLGNATQKALPDPNAPEQNQYTPVHFIPPPADPVTNEQLKPLARREFRLFDETLAKGGRLASGSVGFLRGLAGQGVFQSDTAYARYANLVGRGVGEVGKSAASLAVTGASLLGGTGQGSDFASFAAGVPGFRRGFEGLGILQGYARANAPAELANVQYQALMGVGTAQSLGAMAGNYQAQFGDMGLNAQQSAELMRNAAQAASGTMSQRTLPDVVRNFMLSGMDPNAYLANIANQQLMGHGSAAAMEFNTARGLGLQGNNALAMQSQLFNAFLGQESQGLGATRSGFYGRLLGMGRQSDGTFSLQRGLGTFTRGQGLGQQALGMLNTPFQGLASTMLMADALAQSGGDMDQASMILERLQREGGAGASQALARQGVTGPLARMALRSAGLTTGDIGRINQRRGTVVASDLPQLNPIGVGEGFALSQTLADSDYQRTERIYSEQGMGMFRSAERQGQRIEEFQTGSRLFQMFGGSATAATKAMEEMTTTVIKITEEMDDFARKHRQSQIDSFRAYANGSGVGAGWDMLMFLAKTTLANMFGF